MSALPTERVERTETREQLAAYAHEAWAGWMRYMYSVCGDIDKEGKPRLRVTSRTWGEWQRKMDATYAELSEDEKESDRKEADQMLAIIGGEES